MPKKPIARKVTEDVWEDLLVYYTQNRESNRKHADAQARFDLSRKTLTKLWFEGSAPLGKPPIKSLVDSVEARAKAAKADLREEALKEAESEIRQVMQVAPDMDKELKGKGPHVSSAAMLAASRKNTVVMQTVVGELLMSVYKRLPAMQKEIDDMKPAQLIETMGELRGHLVALGQTAKVIQDLEKSIREEDEARGSRGGEGVIQSPAAAMRVLALSRRFQDRIDKAPLVVIPADGETTVSRVDDAVVESNDSASDTETDEETWDDEWSEDDDEPDAEDGD